MERSHHFLVSVREMNLPSHQVHHLNCDQSLAAGGQKVGCLTGQWTGCQLCLVVVLTVEEQVAGDVSELQGDSLTAEDSLDLVVPHQEVQEGAGLYGYGQGVGWEE